MSYAETTIVTTLAYIFHISLVLDCVRRLGHTLNRPTRETGHKALFTYISFLFSLHTIYFVAGIRWDVMKLADAQTNPSFLTSEFSFTLLLKKISYAISILASDSFIVFRAIVVWEANYVLILPLSTYLASVAAGLGLLIETAQPGVIFGRPNAIDFGMPFWALSATTNVMATFLIGVRLMYNRRTIYQRLNDGTCIHPTCALAATIFVESAALYTICVLAYTGIRLQDIYFQYDCSAFLVPAVSITPTLIATLMLAGKAVMRGRENTGNSLKSAPVVDLKIASQFSQPDEKDIFCNPETYL